MRPILSAALVFLITTVSACSVVVPDINTNRELYLDTHLVTDGEPGCFIAIPDAPGYAGIGQKLADRIQTRFGARLPVRLAAEITDEELKANNVIAIGVFALNPVVERLYRRQLVQCDYSWPKGEAAWVVRTVHNPWLSGTNVVFLGGQSVEGCRRAADWFAHLVESGESGTVSPIVQVTGDDLPGPLDSAGVAEEIAGIQAESSSRTMGRTASRHADRYFQTGHPGWATLFTHAMRRLEALQIEEGAADDVRTCELIFLQWDRIEEGAAFTDSQRLELVNIFHRFAYRLRYATREAKPSETPHGNDWNAAGASYAGLYFSRYYPNLSIGKRLLKNLDVHYEPNMVNWKVNEDCPGYGDITLTDNYQWAMHRPDERYFDNGSLRKMADFDMLVTNNLGEVSGFGDARGLGRKYLVSAYPTAAWMYRDGRYLWWWDHHGGQPTAWWVPPEILPRRRPDDLLGVTRAPLAEWIYKRRDEGRNHGFPILQAYDKVSFRSGFSASDAYMSISGFSYGFHSHADANAIINYGAHGRTILYDDGYMIPSLSEHNTVIILKDGWAGETPELAQVVAQADFDGAGLFRSRLSGYNGLTWDRSVIWPGSGWFLVVDDLVAETRGDYSLQSIWRTLGQTDLQGRRWTSTADTARFQLLSLSDASLAQKESAGTSLNAKPFPLDSARKLVQAGTARLDAGQGYRFANLLNTTSTSSVPQPLAAYRVDGGSGYVVDAPDGVRLVGAGPDTGLAGVRVSASLFCIAETGLTAAGLTRADLPGVTLSATAPVGLSLNLRTGRASVEAAGPVTLSSGSGRTPTTIRAGRHDLNLVPPSPEQADSLRQTLAAALERSMGTADMEVPAPPAQGIKRLWRRSVRASEGPADPWHLNALQVSDLDGDGRHETISAGTDSVIHAIGPDGETLWTYPVGGAVNDLAILSPTGETGTLVVAASDDKTLYAVSHDGTEAWTVTPPPRSYARAGYRGVKPYQSRLTVVFPADLSGDETPEIVVGSANWRTYVYNRAGDLLWDEVCWAHTPTCGAAYDLDGDGSREVIMGNSYNATRIYSAGGELIGTGKGSWHAGPTAVAAGDFDGNGKGEMVVGDREGKIWFQEWNGRDMPNWDTGSDITAVQAADLDGDGRTETVVASSNYLLYCFDADGQPLWQKNLLDACRDIQLADVLGDRKLEIICACEDNTVKVVSTTGKILAQYRTEGWVRKVRACELDGDPETKELVAISDDGGIYGLQITATEDMKSEK
jgi:hypothetical protein